MHVENLNSPALDSLMVDVRPLAWPGTGNASYLYSMLSRLIRSLPDKHWILVSHRGIHPEFGDLLTSENVEVCISRGLASRFGPLWLQTQVPALIRRYKPAVFWASLATLPWNFKKRCNGLAITNFHDLNAYRAPRTMKAWNRWQHKLFNHNSLQNSDKVLCLSQTTKADIQSYFPDIPSQKLVVVYPGCEFTHQAPLKPHGSVSSLARFFLCVGTIEPRKNQAMLINAYLEAKKERPDLQALVIVGRKGWGDEKTYQNLQQGKWQDQGVHYLNNASQGELAWCYKNAAMLTLPSLHEGFGLPVLESFSYKKPALLADIPIFREIAGGQKSHSQFAEPHSTQAWKAAILRSHQLIKSGSLPEPQLDKEEWSWENRAQELSEAISDLLRGQK